MPGIWGGFFIISFLGIIRSVSTGFFLKAASCCLFYFGILIAQNFFLLAWFLLLSSFVLDSIGTGVLRATFRPACSALHFDKEGRPADFVSILRSSLGIRIGLPCVLLFLTYLIQKNLAEGWVIVSLLVLVMACRSSQIFFVKKDLRELRHHDLSLGAERVKLMWSTLALLRKHLGIMVVYVGGGILDSIVLMYGVGLLYRYRDWMLLPESLSWLGASFVSLSLYIIAFLLAAWLVSQWARVERYFLALVLLGLVILILVTLAIFLPGGILFYIGLLGFCLLSSLASVLMTRYASTVVLNEMSERRSAELFMFGELLVNMILVFVVGFGMILGGAENVMRICAVGFAILLVFSCVHYGKLFCKRV